MNANVNTAHRADSRFESAQRLCRAGNEAMRQMMGLYSDGPFTPVQFFFGRGRIALCRAQRPDSRGVRVAFLSSNF